MFNSIKSRLLAVTVMLIVTSLAGYYQLNLMADKVNTSQGEVDLSYDILRGLETLTSHLAHAESGQRGLLLTGDEAYLEPFLGGKEQLHVTEAELKTLLKGEARRNQQLHSITHLIGRKLAEMDHTVSLYRQGKQSEALQLVLSGKGQRVMHVLNALLEKARLDEGLLLEQRKVSLSEVMQKQMQLGVFWLLLNMLIAVFLIILLFSRILNPIAKIMHMTHDFKDGVLGQKMEFKHDDELGELGHTFIEMTSEIEGQHQEMRDKDQLNRQYSSIVAMLAASNDRDMALAEVLAMVSMNFPVPTGAVYLLNSSKDELKLAMVHGMDEAQLENSKLSASLLGETVQSGEFFEIKHLQNTGVVIETGLTQIEPHSIMLIPVIYRAQCTGVVVFAALQELTELQLNVLEKLVGDIAVAMKDIERFEQLSILNDELESSRKQLQQERDVAVEDSITDGLTKVYNRGYLDISLLPLLQAARRKKENLSLFMLDIDYFKKVNDNYGHAAGDEVLRSVAKTMQGSLRETDFVARYGGEEFICILPDAGVEAARLAADKLRQAISLEHYECMDGKSITASMGVAILNADDDNLSAVIVRADKALYHAKESGRDRVVCDVDMQA